MHPDALSTLHRLTSLHAIVLALAASVAAAARAEAPALFPPEIERGGCCLDSSCQLKTLLECQQAGGVWLGVAACGPESCLLGACCKGDDTCEVTQLAMCGPSVGVWYPGLTCDTAPCVQACCLGGVCELLPVSDCLAQQGTPLGPGSTCGPTNPCSGACCYAGGVCVATAIIEDCTDYGGVYFGAGSTCDTNPCQTLPLGACCYEGFCTEVVESECIAALGYQWLGAGTTCWPNPCISEPTGACCIGDDRGSIGPYCIIATEVDCDDFGGSWQGAGTTCEDANNNGQADICEPAPPPGACCLPTGACQPTANSSDCAALGGVFQGVGTVCAQIACPIDPCAVDSDNDGVVDCLDGCPQNPGKTAPGACGCNTPDTDTDGDGTPDCLDGCPLNSGKVSPGACGCATPDLDSDGDGTPDCLDGCPLNSGKLAPGACGCDAADLDSDGDATPDCLDGCPLDGAKTAPGLCGCGTSDVDSDGDGTPDCNDEVERPAPADFVDNVINLLSGQPLESGFEESVARLGSTVDGVRGNDLLDIDPTGRPTPTDPNAAQTAREIENLLIGAGFCPAASGALVLSVTACAIAGLRRRPTP